MLHRSLIPLVAASLLAPSMIAQEGAAPREPSSPTPTSHLGEAPRHVRAFDREAALAKVPIVVENLPIPAVRPTFDLGQRGLPGLKEGTERWLVTFYQRSFDLAEFRTAIYTEAPVEAVNAIVAGLERKLLADQAEFQGEIERLGGRLSHQWWIINGCAVEVPRTALVLLAAMPNVATLDPDRSVEPVLDPKVPAFPVIQTATNAVNHNSNGVNDRGFVGLGVGLAIVDTGQDSNMNGTGQAHRVYFRDGIKPGTSLLAANKQIGVQPADDTHGHGTGVCSIAGGAGWANVSADRGHAYNATKVGYSICDTAGSCNANLSTQASAWNTIAADRATYNIVSANMSYGSSPNPTEASQQALDSCALNANVLIACAAGNNGASTTGSGSCANGLVVAAANATSKTMASFSSRGPLSGDTARFYPDITGCGVDTVMALRNNESGNYTASGTSMASPQVCGAAALVRDANRSLTALETKAILLCSTESIATQNPTAPYNSRNAYGMGFLRDDLAVDAALAETGVFTSALSDNTTRSFPMTVTSGRSYSVVLTWNRSNLTTTTWNNLNLRVLNGAAVVASSATTRNLYEKVVFTAPITGSLTIEVSEASSPLSPNPQTFAICHNGVPDFVVLPEATTVAMGNGDNAIPFSWSPTRYQQVFLGSEIGLAETFHDLRLRQDNVAGAGATGGVVDVEIKLGYTTFYPAFLTTNFANNLNSGTPVTVVARRNIVLPRMAPGVNANPRNFLVVIPFSTPFAWTPAAGRNLIVDVTQRGNSRGNASFSYPLDAHSGPLATTTRLYATPATATTGTLTPNYGLVMALGANILGVEASYSFFGSGCAGTGPGIAQTILPASQAAVMGNANNSIPFSWDPTKYQQVFLGSEQTVARTYHGLGLRQDEASVLGVEGIGVDLELQLGYTTRSNATLTTTFASNYNSGAPTTVLSRQLVVMPTMPAVPNPNPAEFFIKIPFSTPFPYAPAAGRNTLLQVTQRGNTNGNSNFGYFLDATGSGTTARLFGDDTALTGTLNLNYGLVMAFLYNGAAGAVPLLTNSGDPVIGNSFSVDVAQARPGSFAFLFHGISNTAWSFIPLPFSLAGVGAPGCFLRVSGEFIFAVGTNASGRGSVSFTIPGDISLLGGSLFNQYAVSDAGANPLGFSWSRGGAGIMGNK